jgi:hypothetical protein
LRQVIEHEARLREPQEGGGTAGQHLAAVAKRGHEQAIRRLQSPPIPDVLRYLYDWLGELDAARRYDMNGPCLVGYADLAAWAQLTDRHLEPHEVEALLLLDRALLHPRPWED